MNQKTSFTDYEYDNRGHQTRHEQFLASMDEMIPWQDWGDMIEPYYPKGTHGRKPIGVETMLRMYLMLNWFGLSDEGMEDAVYDSYTMGNFLGIDFTHEQALDDTIVRAPSSTQNKDKARNPEMHQTKKGNQWHFGMKIHLRVDAGISYVHTITATAANTHDIVETLHLVREDDHTVYVDSGYLGIEKRDEIKNDEHLSQVEYHIAARPSQNRLTNR